MPRRAPARVPASAASPRLRVSASSSLRAFLLPLLLALAGCANPDRHRVDRAIADYYSGDYRAAQVGLKPLIAKTNGDFVLNNVRYGSAALADYNLDEAEAAFLRAYEVINSVGVNNGGRSVGAVLVDEGIKVWKGEPFERAMANFYLGLVYYIRRDYNNARDAFENALFKLRDYGEGDKEDQYREVETNFALGYLMLGKCHLHLGREDLARANFDRALQLRPDLGQVADYDLNRQSNLLLIVDFGYGPRKTTEMIASTTGFQPTPAQVGPIPPPAVFCDGRAMYLDGSARATVDLLALAQDRRWQSIDTIRTVKSVVGTGLIGAGAYQGLRRNSDPGLALALIGTGLLLKATSQADLRQWEMLPRTTFILPMHVPPGAHDVTVEFPAVPGLRQTWRGLPATENEEATYYIRMQRWATGPYTWPPAALQPPAPPPPPAPPAPTDRISSPPPAGARAGE